ncbi:MAG TPA: amidohydrolase family protein [Casimicrobiaceae bacterium]|nr:amidohydrolase family protein [Casimicrobiaceae bacterium]
MLACAITVGHARAATESQATSTRAADPGVPLVDHHQHLLSPAAAALQNHMWPPVALPAGLARLVQERERAWNDKKQLAAIYTQDATVFTAGTPGWLRGRDRVAAYLTTRFAGAYSLTPVAYRIGESTGNVTGYFTRGAKHIGYFSLAVEKGDDGRWRISGETPAFPGPTISEPETASQLVAYLDQAGIRKAVVLSDAYYFDSAKFDVTALGKDAHAKVEAENDWTAAQVAQFPDRLVAFCSFNPLRDYALSELDRCKNSGHFSGLKLHFGTSEVDLRNPDHVRKVRAVVQAADRSRMPIIVHVRADANYGRVEAEIMLNDIISAAPDVPFQIAHLWGGEHYSDAALRVYADAVARHDPRAVNLYFDLAEVALAAGSSQETLQSIVARMREIGMNRILYGSDGPVADSMSPKDAWQKTRTLPLTTDELRSIAGNVAPYLR